MEKTSPPARVPAAKDAAPTRSNRGLRLVVNGHGHDLRAPDQAILLDVLREELGLTGTKRGCDMGTCGCCTVLINGQARLSCLTLAAQAEGREVTTVEALGSPGGLHPVQAAYTDIGGSQCGFCTPGFIITTKALLDRHPSPSDALVREELSGNLCRCTGYVKILEAVQVAAKNLSPSGQREAPVAAAAPARRTRR